MKIQIILFGKTAKKFLQDSEEFYTKRISPFAQLEYIILPEEKILKGKKREQIQDAEAKKFFKKYTEKNFLIACDVQGKKFSSELFAATLEKIPHTHPGITFVIGGALGLSSQILSKADKKISFSAMTFPHDLFRTLLLEQIYRAFMINANREYHK